ncbi:xanthine dehydrogenase family protein molybdopterin-binding subunit [Mucilaginibacter boryungensis]|uniref:Xanthine dehydrogenase family protein molybdopterin-binding subunit n=1 Tax=Mucilaginibacter boryungensis TaxID=768480 RepID=A0ABR9XJU8_9SPHI|nr:xanthine dehydrogenase family protein molybdopterin-binding subunit [Mucilaginibacter boryungensis]MBE9667285.1 xanthine dehydrogenase family protein molybdopterin-binding subunit [Mucilaginibacter boryungensis]
MEAVSRRSFLKITSIAAGSSLVLGFNFLNDAVAGDIADAVFSPNAYITISNTGLVTLMAPNPEIGQGVKTSLPMILAEELGVKWDAIHIEMAPYDPKYGGQVAGGSGAIRGRFAPLRKAGATARQMLITAAAQQWNAKEDECYAEDGYIIHKPSGKKLSYGELAAKAATLPVPADAPLKDPKDFKIIGTRVHNVDNHKIITGQPLYGIDTRRPGMLFAMVSRPPAFGKKLKSFDDTETRKVTGVKNVVQADGVVAVLATSTWAAKKGRDKLKVVWEDASPLESTAEHEAAFAKLIETKSDNAARNDGDFDKALASGGKVIEAVYSVPNLSHAPMEPMNFFADVKDGKADLFGPTQVPQAMRSEVAKALGIPPENVTLGMPRQGGGFGRKLRPDNGVEAALISAAAKAPVQMMWTREDDIQGDYYRPASMSKYRAVISADNQLIGWHANAAVLTGGSATMRNGFPAAAIPNFRLDNHSLKSNIPTGPWRGPTANAAAFGDESFLDELAIEMKKDPIALRLELLEKAKNQPAGQAGYNIDKFKSVINLVSQMSNWGKNTNKNTHQGFAAYYSFNTYVAQVAEITLINGMPRVSKVYCAVNCGRVVNLAGAENQVEGAIIDGLSHALFSKITFDKGAAVQKNFHSYKFLRMKDAPLEVIVKFVPSEDAPTGLGEPGLPPIAPAVANAIFAATGKRYRNLPFELGAQKSAPKTRA